jgi:hypothetical protein
MPGVIKINPGALEDPRDALAIAFNEALRLVMLDLKFVPEFEVSPEQRDFFAGTEYADDEAALKHTIAARVATTDTSVSATPEQETEVIRLLDTVMEMLGAKHKDYGTLEKMKAGVAAGQARGKTRAAPLAAVAAAGVVAAAAAGDVRTNAPPVSTSVKARALNYVKGAQPEMEAVVDRVVAALVPAEGFADSDTVGDHGKAVGTLQMWDVAVKEANRIVGRDLWTSEDRKDPMRARAMAKVTLSYHYRRGVTDPVELGSKWRNPFSTAPEWYKTKIREALEEK